MKKQLIKLALCVLPLAVFSAGTFDFVIEIPSDNTDFKFYVDGAIDFTVDWGDGQSEQIANGSGLRSHTYTSTSLLKVVSPST